MDFVDDTKMNKRLRMNSFYANWVEGKNEVTFEEPYGKLTYFTQNGRFEWKAYKWILFGNWSFECNSLNEIQIFVIPNTNELK
jgi:hypothetical protein